MVKKLIILGVDGMDWDVVMRYRQHMPNLYAMMERSGFPRLRSVFPADTTPAWSTIYTGLDPSEHGIINFVNVGAKENAYKPLTFEDTAFQGRTFWDQLNQKGMSCAVILPMNIKEGWDIDGIMITRPHNGKIQVCPESKEKNYCPKTNILGTEGKFTSEKDFFRLRREYFDKVEEEIRLTRLAMEQENVDVLFAYFSTTDGIQHDFWRHCDPKHPGYPGSNPQENTIRDMYIRMDDFFGEVMDKQPDTPLLIISDHGHGARPVCRVRINELLRRGGYLTPRRGAVEEKSSTAKKMKRLLKKAVVKIVKSIGLPKSAVKLAKKFPIWKRLFASSADFDWNKTQAYMSDLSAIKNYSYGGIRIHESVSDKDALADEVIRYLSDIQIAGEEGKLFSWIVRTNTFYHGPYLDRYPEIIFQMDERWGGEWELGSNVFEKNGGETVMSAGGHRWQTAIIAGNHIPLLDGNYEMTDIYSIIMKTCS